jgi:4-amino-4-deoxy-L-arabinose transferase-like glycosyltransferase
MRLRRSLWIVCTLAALHGLFFIWYQSPDWTTAWTDQDGYRRLGQVLATRGQFTRFPDAPAFVPEVIRTPAYPMFVAAVYRVFGVGQIPVALAQTALFAAITVLVYAIGRRLATERTAFAAALLAALYPPLPYFAALVMTELWTTFMLTAAMFLAVRAVDEPRPSRFAVLGAVLGIVALSRPAFALFPIGLAALGLLILPLARVRRPPPLRWLLMLAVYALVMLPWFAYNYATLGAFTLSPAGGVGRGIWEGSWQATWSGRLQNELTHLADDIDDRAELDRRVRGVAAREQLAAEPMLEYVHQWEDIRRIWTEPVDSAERARARVRADREYLRVGLENIRRDPPAHLLKRLARGVFVLWAGEIPFRYSDINTLPPWVIYTCWTLQAALAAAALIGLLALARRDHVAEAWLLAAPLVYITAVHFPLLTEARQSLPAQPIVLLLAAVAIVERRERSLAGKPQIHERQHL